MIRKHKQFKRPKKAFDSPRIQSENVIVEKYGLKNKREIWKAKAKLDLMRKRAKKLFDSNEEAQEVFLIKLRKMGYNVKTMVDVLGLTEEDILKRRLQTFIVENKLTGTLKQARQLITHGHVSVKGRVVTVPSYHIDVDEEKSIKLLLIRKIKVAEKKEEMQELNEMEIGAETN